MRWAYEGVVVRALRASTTSRPGPRSSSAGRSSARSSAASSRSGPMYAFVGISGMAKMSSSQGRRPDPGRRAGDHGGAAAALAVRPPPAQPVLQVAFDQEIQRLYDEWDALARKVADGSRAARATSPRTHAPSAPPPASCRVHAAPAAVPHARLRRRHHHRRRRPDAAHPARPRPGRPVRSLDEVRPRLDRAAHWVTTQVPADQRTHVRADPDAELLASLGEQQRAAAAPARRRARRALVPRRPDHPRLRRAEGAGRPRRRTPSRRPSSRPPSARSSRCSTACWSAATPARACPRCCSPSAPTGSAPCSRRRT